jgi:hypothetical protein
MTFRLVGCTAAAAVLAALAATATPRAATPALVTFRQSGGFVALERGFTVRRSGEVVSRGVVVARLPPRRLRELTRALADARWSTLARHYAPSVHVADGYVYTITYAGRPVRIDQGASLPFRLRRPLALLSGLLALAR